ncbi:MAG: hypothetical protein ACUVRP_01970 [Chlorobiales bacterium]
MFISASSGKKIVENTEGWKIGKKAFNLLHGTVKWVIDEGYLPKGNSKSASMMVWAHSQDGCAQSKGVIFIKEVSD